MSDRVPADHPTVDSHRVHLSRVGRTGRCRLVLPEGVDPEGVVSLSLEGTRRWARVGTTLEGEPAIERAASTRGAARDGTGENELRAWLEEIDRSAGEPVVFDVLREGFAYGVRRPGRRVIYTPPEPPAQSLADIARDLDG